MVTMKVPTDSEMGRLLRQADEAGEPLRIETGEATYTVQREDGAGSDANPDDEDVPKRYDPERLRATIRESAGLLSETDAEALKRYIYAAREAGTRGLDRP